MTDETLTPRQVAEELGVTVRTVQRWVADGRLAGDPGRWARARVALVARHRSPGRRPRRRRGSARC